MYHQHVEFYYEIDNGSIPIEINKYLEDHPGARIVKIALTQDASYTVCAVVYEQQRYEIHD